MLYNYTINIIYDVIKNETYYERKKYNSVMRGEIIYGISPFIEILYFFSIKNNGFHYNKNNNIYQISIKFIRERNTIDLENELFCFLYDHNCEIV